MSAAKSRYLPARLIGVAALSLVAACGNGVDRTEDPVRMVFGGQHLSVPNAYFEPFHFPELKLEPDSLFLRVYWPDYTVASTRPVAPDRSGGHEDRIIVSLKKNTLSLQGLYASIASERIETVHFHDRYGLRAFHAEPSRMHHAIRREVYFAHQDQAVTILIICETGHRSPPCKHRFNAIGFAFDLTYSMDRLDDWRAIQDGVTAQVGSFLEGRP